MPSTTPRPDFDRVSAGTVEVLAEDRSTEALLKAGALQNDMNPREVCELHPLHRYDLIPLDLQMPGLDGFQVVEGLKEIETGSHLPSS